MRFELPYGSAPYSLDLGDRDVEILQLPSQGPPPAIEDVLARALAAPFGLPLQVRPGARVAVIVSDATRDEPRAAFLHALRPYLAGARLTLAIATGTHGPARVDELCLPRDWLSDAALVNHDGHAARDIVELGTTSRGTPVRVHRCLVESELVIATGCIRPHYFAGFGAGAKALFPGLGEAHAIRINHRMKTDPRARVGVVDGNPCREDLEEAVAMVPASTFLLDGICGSDERIHDAVAGDLVLAFREGVRRAYPWFSVRARPAPLVVASDARPVSASLYQAAKIAAAVAPLVAEGGTLVLAAACEQGIGPLETVNEAIFRIGVLPRLANGVQIHLVSSLGPDETARTLLAYAPSVESVLATMPGRVLVIPYASHVIAEVDSSPHP